MSLECVLKIKERAGRALLTTVAAQAAAAKAAEEGISCEASRVLVFRLSLGFKAFEFLHSGSVMVLGFQGVLRLSMLWHVFELAGDSVCSACDAA